MEKLLWYHLLSSILLQFLSHFFFSFISKFLTYSFYSHCLISYCLILSWMYPIHRIFAHNTIKTMLLKATNEFCLAKSGGRFLILVILDALNAQDHSLPYIYFILLFCYQQSPLASLGNKNRIWTANSNLFFAFVLSLVSLLIGYRGQGPCASPFRSEFMVTNTCADTSAGCTLC